ncbi:unnamed protein product [Mytilus coruscus]|uniref:Uncharacterized protein n=1 Tax=Mytilus coruscus TaxID=42192 RepID=A0A6J8AWA4_MYTCO|nr:unnamed protein product [Mytilus coruscus]
MKASLIVFVSITGVISGVIQKTNGTCQFNHQCFCYQGNHNLLIDCSNRHLNRIPKFPPTVDILNLHNNSLENIPDKAFENLHELLELDISSNKLTIIRIDAFVGLQNLKRLILEDNRLKDGNAYPFGVFKSLVSLVYLNIKFNDNDEFIYSIIPDYVISDLVKLESLELDVIDRRFGVFVFGEGFSRLSFLKRIKTGACHINMVNNETLSNLPHLEFIDLSNCVIYQYVTGTLSDRTQLIYLDMSNVLMQIDTFKDLFETDIQSSKVKILKTKGILQYAADLPQCFFLILNNTGRDKVFSFADSTMSKIKWATTLFKQWKSTRNIRANDPNVGLSPIRVDLAEMSLDELNYSISRFICEVRKTDGTEYPPDTLYSLAICLQFYMDTLGYNHKKSVVAYQNTENQARCVVNLFELYASHCPPFPRKADALYLRPLKIPNGNIWYADQPIGRHSLANIVASICQEAGIGGYRTNHSLRASAATRMYDAGVDEQLICEVTGHRSNAVRNYKRTNEKQKRKINSVIQGRTDSENDDSGKFKISKSDGNLSITLNISMK